MSKFKVNDEVYAHQWERLKYTWYPMWVSLLWVVGLFGMILGIFNHLIYFAFGVIGLTGFLFIWNYIGDKLFWRCPKCRHKIASNRGDEWSDAFSLASEKVIHVEECPSCHINLRTNIP